MPCTAEEPGPPGDEEYYFALRSQEAAEAAAAWSLYQQSQYAQYGDATGYDMSQYMGTEYDAAAYGAAGHTGGQGSGEKVGRRWGRRDGSRRCRRLHIWGGLMLGVNRFYRFNRFNRAALLPGRLQVGLTYLCLFAFFLAPCFSNLPRRDLCPLPLQHALSLRVALSRPARASLQARARGRRQPKRSKRSPRWCKCSRWTRRSWPGQWTGKGHGEGRNRPSVASRECPCARCIRSAGKEGVPFLFLGWLRTGRLTEGEESSGLCGA